MKLFSDDTPTSKFSFLNAMKLSIFIHLLYSFCRLSYVSPLLLPQQVLHRVRSSPSSLNFQYPRFSFRSSSSCLHLIPPLSVTFILPCTFPSITCFRRQFLRQEVISPVSLPSTYGMQDIFTPRN